jgi:hypothetical protein
MAVGAASITPKSITVGNLLEEHHPFRVPRYQRSYVWETDHVDDFTRDIQRLLDGEPTVRSHFFGGLVGIEHTDHTKPRPHSYEIVDGQQRLATFVLALAQIVRAARALQDAATAAGDTQAADSAKTLATDTKERFLRWNSSNVREGRTDNLPRLTLSLMDDPVFQDLLAGRSVTTTRESHELLVAADALIYKTLVVPIMESQQNRKDKVEQLDRLRTALIDQSHVIYIVSDSRERAYQLFSVLNDRGRSLEDADLLRSHTLELLDGYASQQETVATLWDEILSAPAKDVSAFFKAYYPSTTGERASAPMFAKLVKEYFAKGAAISASEADLIVEQVRVFRDELDVYQRLADGIWPYPPSKPPTSRAATVAEWQRDRLKRLIKVLKHELALPLLLAAGRSSDEQQFAELVYMLEIFAFRYKNVCNGHASAPAKAYYKQAKAAHDAHAQGTIVKWVDLRKELCQLIDDVASDDQFRDDLINRLQYSRGTAQRANIRELLTTVEDHSTWLAKGACGRPKPDMTFVPDLEQVTLEHIYPLNPEAGEEVIDLEPVKSKLGNLTFFGPGDNADAGNKRFAIKQQHYYKPSRVLMTRALADLPQWTLAEFEQRQRELVDHAGRVFVL